jgi:hypothetical protein
MTTQEEIIYAEQRVHGILNGIMFRQREQAAQEETFAAGKNYEAAAACRARVTGLMIAENLVREELQTLSRFKAAQPWLE